MESSQGDRFSANPNFSPSKGPVSVYEVINRTRRFGGCTRCLSIKHDRRSCRAMLRCAACFNYGHRFSFCLTRARPNIAWKPKITVESVRSKPTQEASGVVEEEQAVHSHSSPNSHPATEDPTGGEDSTAPVTGTPCQTTPTSPSVYDHREADMANFAVDPTPFIPEGLEVEEWARPARGRIVITGNPPRRHEEYAVISVVPHPQIICSMILWMR